MYTKSMRSFSSNDQHNLCSTKPWLLLIDAYFLLTECWMLKQNSVSFHTKRLTDLHKSFKGISNGIHLFEYVSDLNLAKGKTCFTQFSKTKK